jgi:hypothetical protein
MDPFGARSEARPSASTSRPSPCLIISFIPRRFGQPPDPGNVAELCLELLAGLAAIILRWQPASSRFFSAAKAAHAARV